MEIQDFQLKLKSVGDQGEFSGFAATYGNVDLGGDKILPGAFTRTIQQQPPQGVPLLWVHDQASPVGTGKLSDSAAGLVIDGTLELEDPTAQKAYRFMKSGAVRGLSIGYDPIPSKTTYDFDSGVRTLGEVKVFEVSLCAVPMNQRAVITNIKSLDAVTNLLRGLRDVSNAEDVAQLVAVDRELKRLLPGRKDYLCQCPCSECTSGDCMSCSNEACSDEHCDANWTDAEDLAMLKNFAASLKALAV